MPFIQSKCPKCNKTAEVNTQHIINNTKVWFLKCGHMLTSDPMKDIDATKLISMRRETLFPFQVQGVKFIENASGRALITDDCGLGKTVQALASLALHTEMQPFFAIVKAGLKTQWQYASMNWLGEDAITQIIDGGKDHFIPNCTGYIIAYDTVPRFNQEKLLGIRDKLKIKTIILDEVQQIKNTEAKRTAAIRNICKDVPYIIGLSATPIKNNAEEYFSILNILKPELFPRKASYIINECDSYWDGYRYKTGGLRYPDQFKKKTENFIIRRERTDEIREQIAMKCKGEPDRQFRMCDLGESVEEEYLNTFKAFRDDYDYVELKELASFEKSSKILAYLSKMRHLVGLSKIDPAIDFTCEFLGSNERKLTIFIHHKDVSYILKNKLSRIMKELDFDEPLDLVSEMNGDQRANIIDAFVNNPRKRVLIASTLASGEGLNLQVCSDCIMLERQWNPANEEQAEGRFIRIGQTASVITATYFVAVGTVDEFFSEIVERKREIVRSTLNSEESKTPWDQTSIMKELAETLAQKGGKRWSI